MVSGRRRRHGGRAGAQRPERPRGRPAVGPERAGLLLHIGLRVFPERRHERGHLPPQAAQQDEVAAHTLYYMEHAGHSQAAALRPALPGLPLRRPAHAGRHGPERRGRGLELLGHKPGHNAHAPRHGRDIPDRHAAVVPARPDDSSRHDAAAASCPQAGPPAPR